jgi:hypothetical protein
MKKIILIVAFTLASSLAFANTDNEKVKEVISILEMNQSVVITAEFDEYFCTVTVTSWYKGWSITRNLYACDSKFNNRLKKLHADVKKLADAMNK